jgi:hypothetical protein
VIHLPSYCTSKYLQIYVMLHMDTSVHMYFICTLIMLKPPLLLDKISILSLTFLK